MAVAGPLGVDGVRSRGHHDHADGSETCTTDRRKVIGGGEIDANHTVYPALRIMQRMTPERAWYFQAAGIFALALSGYLWWLAL